MKRRLDEELAKRGLATSRSEAKTLIIEGKVKVNGEVAKKVSLLINDTDVLTITERRKYVSRGGLKLEHALRTFCIDVSGLTVLDVGASTGGFTDCLLKHGAKKVYAVDVGYGQIDLSLRNDERVTLIERFNARYLNREVIPEPVDLATVDVSFISILKVLPAVKQVLSSSGRVIALIKPQFESQRKHLRKGVVRSSDVQISVLSNLVAQLEGEGLFVRNIAYSPIRGNKGNIEFFFLISTVREVVNLPDVSKIVEEAQEMTK